MSRLNKYFPPQSCWRSVFCLLHSLRGELLQKPAKEISGWHQSSASDTSSDVSNYSQGRDGNHSALTFKNTRWPFASLSLCEMLREINRGAPASSQIPSPNGIKLIIKLLLRRLTLWPFFSNMMACPHILLWGLKPIKPSHLHISSPATAGRNPPHWPSSCLQCFKFLRSLN